MLDSPKYNAHSYMYDVLKDGAWGEGHLESYLENWHVDRGMCLSSRPMNMVFRKS